MRADLLCFVILGCGNADPRPEHVIDANRFHVMLGDPSQAERIQEIHVDPNGPTSARYEITYRDRNTKDVVYAEFPGRLVDEINAAHILYDVKPHD